jgi:hypothetical protein
VQLFAGHRKALQKSLPKMASDRSESRRFSQYLVSRPGKMSIKAGDGLKSDQKSKKH